MKRDEAVAITESALIELNESLRDGKNCKFYEYLQVLSAFPQYSFRNIFLILKQFPEATQVAGFNSWRKVGRWIKAGEKGIGIVAPLASRAKPETGEKEVYGFRVVHVFDVSQTDGEEIPEVAKASGEPHEALEALEEVYARLGIKLEAASLQEGCSGVSFGGRVVVDEKLTLAERFSVLAHELGHELLHQKNDAEGARPAKQVRELEAEAVAYVVCFANGVNSGEAARDYIYLYQGDESLLAASLERVRRAASEILRLMDDVREGSSAMEVQHAA